MKRHNIADPEFSYDDADPDGFHVGYLRLRKLLGSEHTGISVYELPPGQSNCPYHYEVGEEEWLLVLSGHPTVRHPEGSDRLDPLDVVFFPTGPAGAHRIENRDEETARVLMFSDVVVPTATYYPDSDKVGVWTDDPETELMVRREAKVEYYDGEGGEP
jgi:uncharacterized cupin superfamily protein